MSEPNHSGNYNHIRCLTCGRSWAAWYDPVTGKGEGPHPSDLPCNRQRPTSLAPAWVEVALANHKRAAGGTPPGEFLAAVMARAKNGDEHA